MEEVSRAFIDHSKNKLKSLIDRKQTLIDELTEVEYLLGMYDKLLNDLGVENKK